MLKEGSIKAVSNHYEAYNEPSMLQLYLFIWAGRPVLTQKFVRIATNENFSDKLHGLPGNDDIGTTSALYLWSKIGIFHISGQNLYLIGSPSSKHTKIKLSSGKKIELIASNASEKNIYIQSVKLNEKKYKKAFFTHEDILNGAKFEFEMGPSPSKWRRKLAPPSLFALQSLSLWFCEKK